MLRLHWCEGKIHHLAGGGGNGGPRARSGASRGARGASRAAVSCDLPGAGALCGASVGVGAAHLQLPAGAQRERPGGSPAARGRALAPRPALHSFGLTSPGVLHPRNLNPAAPGSDPQDPTETPGGKVGLSAVVVHEDRAVAPVTEERTAQTPDRGWCPDPTGRFGVEFT